VKLEKREILFRGQFHIQDVALRWVYGYVVELWTEKGQKQRFGIEGRNECNVPERSLNIIEVIPETVTQYTGLKDCKDKKIFEGDIIKAIHSGVGFVGVVRFKNSGFQVFNSIKDTSCFNFDIPTDWEVVDNIWETPEFFKSNHSC